MRLAIIASAAPSSSAEPSVGERDASLVASRLVMQDLAFETCVLDPYQDLAEQLDEVLRQRQPQDALLYASGLVAVVDDNECYLCLDPNEPEVGDSLRDLSGTLAERARGSSLMILEARYDEADGLSAEDVADAICGSVNPGSHSQTELIVAARPQGAHVERIPSRLTAGLLEFLDSRSGSLSAEAAFESLENADLGSWPNAATYVPSDRGPSFVLRGAQAQRPAATPRGLRTGRGEPAMRGKGAPASKPAAARPAEPAETGQTLRSVVTASPRKSKPVEVAVRQAQEEPVSPPAAEPEAPPPPVAEPEAPPPPVAEPEVPPPPVAEPEVPPAAAPAPPQSEAPPTEKSERAEATAVTTALPRSEKPAGVAEHALPKVMVAAAPEAPPAKTPPSPAKRQADDLAAPAKRLPPPPKKGAEPTSEDQPKPSPADDLPAPSKRLPPPPKKGAEPATNDKRKLPLPKQSPPAIRAAAGPANTRDILAALDSQDRKVATPTPGADQANVSYRHGTDALPGSFLEDRKRDVDNGRAVAGSGQEAALSFLPPVSAGPPPEKPAEYMTHEDHLAWGDWELSRKNKEGALTHYKSALGRLGTMKGSPARAEVYMRLGAVNQDDKPRVAIANFDKALAIMPENEQILTALVQLNISEKNTRAAQQAEKQLLPLLTNKIVKFERMMDFALRWLKNGDTKRAKKRFERIRDENPKRPEPLSYLLQIYQEEGSIDHVLDTRRRIAMLIQDRLDRAEAYLAIGRYCLSEHEDREDEGLAAFELALDADPTNLEALEVLTTTLSEQQEWGELERIYRKLIGNLEQLDPDHTKPIIAELHHRLAVLYREDLDDNESALAALEKEIELFPDKSAVRLLAAEVAVQLGDPVTAVRHLRKVTELAPRRVEAYHNLFTLAQTHDEPDLAFLAAAVATLCGEADERERFVYLEHKVDTVPPHRRRLRPAAWRWLRDVERDENIDIVMRAIAPAILRMRILQLDSAGKLPDVDSMKREEPHKSSLAPVRSLGWCGEHLGIQLPAIYVDQNLSGTFYAPLAKHQVIFVGRGALTGRSAGELAFLAARHLTMRTPEHELVSHHHSIEELSACFLAALELVLGTSPASGGTMARAVATLAQVLRKSMSLVEREELSQSVYRFQERSGQINLKQWVASVERCATRAGLLMCGDLATAIRLLQDEAGLPSFLSVDVRVDDLCSFSVSSEYIKLRQELGSAISDEKTIA